MYQLEMIAILAVTAAACALPGVYLLLRRLALVSDAIGHVLLLGIVLAFFLVRDLESPWLLLGAALSGVLAVALVELLQQTGKVRQDAAIGLVFPAMFSLGILLVSFHLRNTHLDVDRVLLGSPEFATFRRAHLGAYPLGPAALWLMGGVLVLNVAFLGVFHKELKLSTFDAGLAASFGFFPGLLHYALMGVVSLTAVAAFDTAGPVLVVAFMVVPGATGYLLTDRLTVLLPLSAGLAALGGVLGTLLALALDANIAGSVATVLGMQFALAWTFAPGRGLLAQALRRRRQRREFYETMLAVHLLHHEGTPEEAEESRLDGLHTHLGWRTTDVARVVASAEARGLVERQGPWLRLTRAGRRLAQESLGGYVGASAGADGENGLR